MIVPEISSEKKFIETDDSELKKLALSLGLRDPDLFAIEQLRKNLSEQQVANLGVERAFRERMRGTGVTTRAYLQGLLLARSHKVIFIVQPQHKDLRQKQLYEYLSKTPLPAGQIQILSLREASEARKAEESARATEAVPSPRTVQIPLL